MANINGSYKTQSLMKFYDIISGWKIYWDVLKKDEIMR